MLPEIYDAFGKNNANGKNIAITVDATQGKAYLCQTQCIAYK